MFKQVFSRTHIKPGMRMRICNTALKGVISEVYDKLDEVVWDGTTPCFVVLKLDTGSEVVMSPYKLTRKKAK